MKPTEFWKNFILGDELSISGALIYNGLRRFHELKNLNNTDEIFEVFYYLSVGIERLLKIVVVLLEHTDTGDQEVLEQSLITHNHLELLRRIKKHGKVKLSTLHNEFLALLATFYKTYRYDRFSLASAYSSQKEKAALLNFLRKHLGVTVSEYADIFGNHNEAKYRKFVRKIVIKISKALYEIVERRASELNLYTYELRTGSKACTVFLGDADIPAEDVLWKELLIFFMNTKSTSGYLAFLRGIEPLHFDPGLADDYLDCFQSDTAKALVMDELESLYEDVKNKGERLELMEVIGGQNVSFDNPESEEEPE